MNVRTDSERKEYREGFRNAMNTGQRWYNDGKQFDEFIEWMIITYQVMEESNT